MKKVKETSVVEESEVTPIETVSVSTPVTERSSADEIWEAIRTIELNMFSLPGQTVEKHCTRHVIEPSRVYLTIRTGAVLPALEEVLGTSYAVESSERFVTIAKR